MSRDEMAAAIQQLGRDEMAAALAELLDSPDAEACPDGWRDGVEDALLTLIQSGASDPR